VAGESLNAVAADFHRRFGVAPDLMVLIGAVKLWLWLGSAMPT
jgi:hypothetical protein